MVSRYGLKSFERHVEHAIEPSRSLHMLRPRQEAAAEQGASKLAHSKPPLSAVLTPSSMNRHNRHGSRVHILPVRPAELNIGIPETHHILEP